ncbi:hypothetical protein SB30_100038 [Klebsiella quasipneumoniae subsp. similipneumoniae]|nr:hypothetical protein SB30_100038 [Klebsiella quasipneumoniae subsp. similipneumoniae]
MRNCLNTASCGVEVVPFAIGSSLPAYPAGTLPPMNDSGTPETGVLHSAPKTYFPGLQARHPFSTRYANPGGRQPRRSML